jgi:hypothetical protein
MIKVPDPGIEARVLTAETRPKSPSKPPRMTEVPDPGTEAKVLMAESRPKSPSKP